MIYQIVSTSCIQESSSKHSSTTYSLIMTRVVCSEFKALHSWIQGSLRNVMVDRSWLSMCSEKQLPVMVCNRPMLALINPVCCTFIWTVSKGRVHGFSVSSDTGHCFYWLMASPLHYRIAIRHCDFFVLVLKYLTRKQRPHSVDEKKKKNQYGQL